MKINITGPNISQKEIDYVMDAAKNAWYENAYSYNRKFEDAFAAYIGRKYALSLPSCTSAIHLSLLALDIREGDEVIVPDITWIATIAPIHYVGAIPVFADVDKDTWCIDCSSIEHAITERTKAIITVDLYGAMPDYDKIIEIANKHSLYVIEDAAQAIGSTYKGTKAGAFGNTSVFSFHGTKAMTTGEGGMLLTDSKELYDRAAHLGNYGRAPNSNKMFWLDEISYKYRMSSMQAAMGLAQLERIDEIVEHKINIFNWYKDELKNVAGLQLNYIPKNDVSNFWMVTITWKYDEYGITKEELMDELSNYDIASRPFFYPLSMTPATEYYTTDKNYAKMNGVAYSISPYAVNLPCGGDMTNEKVKYVCRYLKKILGKLKIGI